MKNDLRGTPLPARQPNKNMRLIVLVTLAVLVAAYFLFFNKKTEEDRVREVIQTAAQAAKDRNPAHFSECLTEDFKTVHGLGKDELHQILVQMLMFRYKQVEVVLRPAVIPVILDQQDLKHATAEFKANVTGQETPDGPWEQLTDHAGGTIFKCEFHKTDKGWQFSRVDVEKEK